MMFASLLNNAVLLLALGYLYSLIARRWEQSKLAGQACKGLIFGLVALGVMCNPVPFLPGIVFDTRSVVLGLAGLFGGPVTAAVAVAMAAAYRIWGGGAGVFTGVLVAVISGLIGACCHVRLRRMQKRLGPLGLYAFGLAVHLAMLLCMLTLGWSAAKTVLAGIWLPVLLIYPVVTLLLALLLADGEKTIETEKNLAASENRFRSSFENANIGMVIIGVDGRLLRVNEQFRQMLGYDGDELLGRNFNDITHPDDRQLGTEFVDKTMAGQFQAARFEKRYLRKDGSVVWARVSSSLVRDANGDPLHFITHAQDITERKQAEARHQRDEARLESLLRIAQYKAVMEQDLLDYALEEALSLTGSEIGYIYHYHENRREFVLNTWSKDVMSACAVTEPQTTYHLDKTGIWGEAVRQRRPVVINDFSRPNPLSKGCPPGHVPMRNFCTVPVIFEDGIVAVAGVANKQGDYDDADVRQLILLMDAVWKILGRQRAVKEFLESERRFRLLFEEAPMAYQSLDENGHILNVNRAWLDTLGYDYDAVVGKWFGDFLAPDSVAQFERALAQLKSAGKVSGVELAMVKADGGVLTVSLESAVARHPDGSFRQTHGIFQDISQRKEAERALRRSLELSQNTLDALSSHIAILDQSGVIVAVNAAWRQFGRANNLGLAEFAVGTNYLALCQAAQGPWSEEAPLVAAAIAELLAGRRRDFYLEYPCHGPGEQRWFALRMSRFTVDGQTRLVLAHENITHRRMAEEALRQSEEKFRLSFSTSPDSININRLSDGMYVEINQGFTKLTGFTRDDVAGKTSAEINVWADMADRQRLVDGLREKGYYENLEARFRRKDGSVTTALMSAKVIDLEGQLHIISITRDISERINAEKERVNLEEQLRQAQKMEAIGTLAGGIAHDFNNILAAILGFAEMAHDDAQAGQVNPSDLQQIMLSALRAKELVKQILAFSRKQEPNFKSLDLNQVVRGTQAILDRTLPKMINIKTNLARGLPAINADPTQIEQVLLNLSSNAMDAMPDGGALTIETSLVNVDQDFRWTHPEVLPGPYVLLRFADSGVGIDSAIVERVFEPFFTTKEIGKGTGLGLSSAYGIIKNHGGHIFCQSEKGHGTSFTIYLPARVEDGRPLQAEAASDAARQMRGTERILLADDEEALRQLGAMTLGRAGYQVVSAASGEEAIEIYRREGGHIDLVVMDLGMPGMGGHKALKAILELNPKARVVIASGYAAKLQVKDALEAGAAGYVAKPYMLSDLLSTVRGVLDRP